MKFLLVIGLCLTSFFCLADKNKRARKAMLKGDFEKAEVLLAQSMDKAAVNPGANYLLSLLYTIDTLERYDIDTAQQFILESIKDWELLAEKEQSKLLKNGFGPDLFQKQKRRIDSLGFERAAEKGDVAAYEAFVEQFADAGMVQRALNLRDSVAFANAASEDSWQSYQAFYQKYPNARQVPEAEERYKTLIFRDLTSDRRLSSFREFLQKFPNTPYRKEAEEQIFEIMTATNAAESYLQFIADYPRSPYAKKALDFLYGLDQDAFAFRYFPRYTLSKNLQDSLDRLRSLEAEFLVPVYENNKYGFVNASGNFAFAPVYSWIPDDYLCGAITQDFLFVGLDEKTQVINRMGEQVLSGDFEFAEDMGLGLIKVGREEVVGVWHKSGYEILNLQYQDAEILDNSLLKIVQDDKVGLATITGRVLLAPHFDDIVVEGNFWVFVQDERLAFTSLEKIAAIANQQELELTFDFDELERLPGGFLLGYDGDTETLISNQHQVIIPKAVQNIYPMGDNWLVKQPFGYRLFYSNSGKLTDSLFPELDYNNNWLALKSDTAWALVNKYSASTLLFNLDSAKIVNEDVAVSFKGLVGTIHFGSRTNVTLEKGEKVYVLEEGYSRENYKSEERFLVKESLRSKLIYNMQGKLLFEQKSGNLRYLSPAFLVLEQKGKVGIIDSSGASVLPVRYDGIGQADAEGFVTVLQDGKFGSFHLQSRSIAPPKFDTRVRYFNHQLLKTTLQAKVGLIDYLGKTVLPFEFEEVLPWNDTLVMAKKGEFWSITTTDGKQTLFQPFIHYSYIRDSKEEKIVKVYAPGGYGILSNVHGQVLAPTYNDLINLGTEEQPLYFAEKHVREAEFFVVVYTDAKGNPIRSQAFRADEYDKIFCEE